LDFLLITLTLALHLVCMNAATGGPLVCIWLDWREHRGDRLAGRAGRFLATWSIALFLVGLILGVGTALLAWSGEFAREFMRLLPRRIYWGYWELGFSAALMAGYAWWWRIAPGRAGARIVRSILALLASTNLLYHFPPLFVVAAKLATGEAQNLGAINDKSFPRLIWQGEVFALSVHFGLASLAVTGMLLSMYSLAERREDAPEEQPARAAAWGGGLALAATLLQIPVGVWLLMETPVLRQTSLLGGDLVGTSLLGAGVLAAVALLHHLAGMAMGDSRRPLVLRTAVLLLGVILLMTAALRWSRPI
jgi:hypothetical protein